MGMQILDKLTIGGDLELKNRVVLAPLTRARCTPTEDPLDPASNVPNDIMAEYYSQRASGGLIITEATAISEAASGWRNAPHIKTAEEVAAWKKVVDAVHEKNGVIFLQLWHMGRQGHASFHPTTNKTLAPSAIPMKGVQIRSATGENTEGQVPTEMTLEDIQETIRDYVNAAKLCKEAGFDGVEIHSANGYLLDTFLQSSTNTRTDEYGGSPENRLRIVKEIFEAIVESGAYPASRIGFRISPNGVFGDMGSADNKEMFTYVAQEMNTYKPAYLHVMDGLGFGFHNKGPVVTTFDIRKNFDGPIMANVGLTKDMAEGLVRSGTADLVCFGRLYMSNPDLPERFANNWPTEPESTYENWWQPTGAKGYTDYPFYKEEEQKEPEAEVGNAVVEKVPEEKKAELTKGAGREILSKLNETSASVK